MTTMRFPRRTPVSPSSTTTGPGGRGTSHTDIVRAELIALRFDTGRYRLVGFSPGRPRHFVHWDRKRPAKPHGVSLDVGRWRQLAITPDDPDTVLDRIRSQIG